MNWLLDILKQISEQSYYTKPDATKKEHVRLDSNENLMLSRKFALGVVNEAIQNVDLRVYPDERYEAYLYHQLEKYLGIDQKYIAVGSGSDQIIELLLSTIGHGKRVTILSPTFSYFVNRCQLHGLELTTVPLGREDNTIYRKEFLRLSKQSEIIYICSPNNPTGNQFDKDVITELMLTLKNKLVLIDEAYVEFGKYSLASMATKYENILVLRTLSKAFGLAGARVGYMVANENIANIFKSRIQLPYSLSTLSLRIASIALARYNQVRKTIERVKIEREKIFESLSNISNIKPYRSDSNFVFVECGEQLYSEIIKKLKQELVYVRLLGNIDGRLGCIRVTVGTREMNNRFLEAIESASKSRST
jgi:histidinol-phosphate aminotransferase